MNTKLLQMLKERIDRYTSLEKYNLDAVVSLNLNGRITSVNPATERICGYTAAQLTGKHFTELLHEEHVPDSQSLFHYLFAEGEMLNSEVRIRHQLGYPVDLLVTPTPIYSAGNLVGCYIIAKDITERKRKDELLMKSEKLSVAGQLAAGVAHEIRNPLTALKGFVQLMEKSEAYIPKYLPIMKEELTRIELIINELIMLGKPQDAQMKRADLMTLIEDVILLIESHSVLQNIGILLTSSEQRYFIRCDANQLKQAFINFLKNAIEDMPKGGVIQVDMGINSENEVVVRITDQGNGISEEQLRRIGEPFYSTKEAGTGLGMLVSHKIIEYHDGRIRITSEVGIGTTIFVTLPILKSGTRH